VLRLKERVKLNGGVILVCVVDVRVVSGMKRPDGQPATIDLSNRPNDTGKERPVRFNGAAYWVQQKTLTGLDFLESAESF
jgi:hypothetical protein